MKIFAFMLLLAGFLYAEEITGECTIWYDSEGNVVMVEEVSEEAKKKFVPQSERREQERLARQKARSLPGVGASNRYWRSYGWGYYRPGWSAHWTGYRHHPVSLRGCYRHRGSGISIILNR